MNFGTLFLNRIRFLLLALRALTRGRGLGRGADASFGSCGSNSRVPIYLGELVTRCVHDNMKQVLTYGVRIVEGTSSDFTVFAGVHSPPHIHPRSLLIKNWMRSSQQTIMKGYIIG